MFVKWYRSLELFNKLLPKIQSKLKNKMPQKVIISGMSNLKNIFSDLYFIEDKSKLNFEYEDNLINKSCLLHWENYIRIKYKSQMYIAFCVL